MRLNWYLYNIVTDKIISDNILSSYLEAESARSMLESPEDYIVIHQWI